MWARFQVWQLPALKPPRDHGRALWRAGASKFGLDRNPLRRRSDRIESAALATALLLCVAALPLAALVGIWMRGELLNTAEHQARTRVPAVGTVLDERPPAAGVQVYAPTTARVAWTTPDGLETVGRVTVPSDARPGSRVTVWTTSQGVPTDPPLTASQVTADAAAVAMSVQATAMGLAWLAFVVVRRLLERGRYRAWETAWMQIDPGQDS
jgi:hypothetical protein